MVMFLYMESHILERLKEKGRIFTYSEMEEEEIKQIAKRGMRCRPLYIIKESEAENIMNNISPIILRESNLTSFFLFESNFKKKEKKYLKADLCIRDKYFVPDTISKSDVLYFFIPDKSVKGAKHFFLITKDYYLDSIQYREHAIFGIIDIAGGKNLLLRRDHEIKPLMKIFYNKIDSLAQEYKDILFITISDSVLVKANFTITTNGE